MLLAPTGTRKRVRSTYYRAVGLINRNVRGTILVRLICSMTSFITWKGGDNVDGGGATLYSW